MKCRIFGSIRGYQPLETRKFLVYRAEETKINQRAQQALDEPNFGKRLSAAARNGVTEHHILRHTVLRIVKDLRKLDTD